MNFKHYIGLACVALLMASCSDKVDVIGSTETGVSDNFAITAAFAVSEANPNFYEDDVVNVTATFNEEASVTVKFTGQESGAVRTLKFRGQTINTGDLIWYGEHEDYHFFRSGEDVSVSYSIAGYVGDLGSETVSIERSYHYRAGRNNALHRWSFEDDDVDGDGPTWGPYPSALSAAKPAAVDFVSPNGTKAGKWYSDSSKTGYRNGSAYGGSGGRSRALTFFNGLLDVRNTSNISFTSNPDSVWFNVYLYGQGDPHVRATLVLGERDCPYGPGQCEDFGTNSTGDIEYWSNNLSTVDDRVLINQSLEHTGWKLFSYRYSSIAFATNEEYGGSGNKTYEPHRLNLIAIDLESDLPGYAEFYVDFPIITFGGPFDPSIIK